MSFIRKESKVLGSFFVEYLLLVQGLFLRLFKFPTLTTLVKKKKFHFASGCPLKMASIRDRGMLFTFPFSSRSPSGSDLHRLCACCHSFCEVIHASVLFCLERLVFVVPSIYSLILKLFMLPLLDNP